MLLLGTFVGPSGRQHHARSFKNQIMAVSPHESQRQVLTSFEDVAEAAVLVASSAKRSITILTPDLEPGIYDSEGFLEAVKRLVLAKRIARVRVLITDPGRTVRNGNRLISLGRRLNAHLDFRNLHEDFREQISGAFIIADETAVLYRADGRRFDGIMGSFEPSIARQHLDAIEEAWQASVYQYQTPVGHI